MSYKAPLISLLAVILVGILFYIFMKPKITIYFSPSCPHCITNMGVFEKLAASDPQNILLMDVSKNNYNVEYVPLILKRWSFFTKKYDGEMTYEKVKEWSQKRIFS